MWKDREAFEEAEEAPWKTNRQRGHIGAEREGRPRIEMRPEDGGRGLNIGLG